MSHGHRGRSPGASERSPGSRGRGASASSHQAQTSLVVDENLPATTPPEPPTVDGAELQVHHRSARHPSAAGTTSSRGEGSRSSSTPGQASSLGAEAGDHFHDKDDDHPATPSPRRSGRRPSPSARARAVSADAASSAGRDARGAATSADALSPAAPSPARRGRGRPRKESQAPPVPKRRRGRPPNVRPDMPSPNGGAAGSSPPAAAAGPPALHTPDATEPGSSRSTPAATLRRGPGRPRKQTNTSATPVRICPTTGDKVDDLLDSGIGAQHDFSLTISARNSGNVESHGFEYVDKYLQERMVRGLVSLERGNVHGNLHLQGILTAGLVKHFDDPRKEEAAMRKSMRQACEWKSHVKVKIVIKRLMRQQTFSGMLGYCSKDQGRPH
ncbi:expressed unknown protein [Ectocarpus siliculosus]|uniref:Replitron HUH endonuclease domain-containing protein n=1 Tax=Ectocarpus siliculosus TaxID=2880 RepID=D7G6Z2_ECTSI|nr:expressed unknown protein [Ectocarpus siliculosus]|eukprot:CBJ25685.1 expressed unknown protein [Ectocarpus siliculosus]